MKIVPYLDFDGPCREAFELYTRCLGGTTVDRYDEPWTLNCGNAAS